MMTLDRNLKNNLNENCERI